MLKPIFKSLLLGLSCVRLIPHVLVKAGSANAALIDADVLRWAEIYCESGHATKHSSRRTFMQLMTTYPEFRSLFYYRTAPWGGVFQALCRPMPTLFIHTRDIGSGLFIQHGFATIISAERIGRNCWINQQVTIGWKDKSGGPRIGDNVTINAGAKVIGNISIGSNTTIGANAVVVKDVPAHCTVVGVPARIVKRDGVRVDEKL